MKLRFEPDLPHQHAAITAVADLFKGQELGRTEFTVTRTPPESAQGELGYDESALGVGNRLTLLPEELTANLQAVQLRNALKPVEAELKRDGLDFTVEMETGTGKTYVYLRTIFELNRLYGFTKFMIITPSVAIREGVAKTLEMTADHFRSLYAGVPMDWFVYDSAKLGQVRDYAASATIKIMVATIGALNKLETNVFYAPNEKTGGEKPVDLVRATRPVIIIDEPQSVEGRDPKGAGARALREMGSLCRLRYSATHLHKHQMIYRLDAVDAYQAKLVKRIDVAGLEITNADNAPYVKLLQVRTGKGKPPKARVEVGLQRKTGVTRDVITVRDGDDLEIEIGRSVYAGVSIGTIEGGDRGPLLQLNLPGETVYLGLNQAHGDVDRTAVVRQMIRRSIKEHFDREKALKPLGIKVLSLFFIDKVSNYRLYGDDGTMLGPYGVIFEEEYRKLAAHPDYRESLFSGRQPEPERAHDGYFSQDRKGRVTEPELNASGELKNAASRDDAERGFRLIMRDKERLLDEAEPLRFIFSHSALREGWDNPNVFQICVLRDMAGDRERRQTIGRGLRLCVDAHGERRRDEGLNVLTVVADESYADFADGLQADVARDLEIRFGMVDRESFAALPVTGDDGVAAPLGAERSSELYAWLRAEALIDAKGRIEDELRLRLKAGTLQPPADFEAMAPAVRALLAKLAGRLEVGNADERKPIGIRKEVLLGADFQALWDRIKTRTTYRVDFDAEALITDAVAKLKETPHVLRAQARFVKAEIQIDAAGVHGVHETTTPFQGLTPDHQPVPDILGELQNRTLLTRRSLARILIGSGKLEDLRANPAAFLDQAAQVIKRAKERALVDGVRYQRLGEQEAYAQELFGYEEITGYLKSMVPVTHAVTDHIATDSEVERQFARDLDKDEGVRVFAKLPAWFKVPTPLGSYNPDWAVLVSHEGGERLYFVVETKGSAFLEDLRTSEADLIRCGNQHFAKISESGASVRFVQATAASRILSAAG